MAVGVASRSHIIVGMVDAMYPRAMNVLPFEVMYLAMDVLPLEVMYLVAMNVLQFHEHLTRFMIPTLLGKTTGGAMLVAMLNHQQASAGHA